MQNNWSINGFFVDKSTDGGGKTVVWTPIQNGPKWQSYEDTRLRA